jgi:hypothetical protein
VVWACETTHFTWNLLVSGLGREYRGSVGGKVGQENEP